MINGNELPAAELGGGREHTSAGKTINAHFSGKKTQIGDVRLCNQLRTVCVEAVDGHFSSTPLPLCGLGVEGQREALGPSRK